MLAQQFLQKLLTSCSLALLCLFAVPTITQATPLVDGANAIGLIGQYQNLTDDPLVPDYTARAVNNGGVGRVGLNSPRGVEIDAVNKRMFIVDSGNNRILVFNLNDDLTLTDKIADYVLGQPNFVTATGNTTVNGLLLPAHITFASTTNQLFVADRGNSRVVVYDTTSIVNGEDAINVLGQPDFTTNTISTTASTMNYPESVSVDEVNKRLFVGDTRNNRVLMFDLNVINNGEDAVNVFGQQDFLTQTAATTQIGMNNVGAVHYDHDRQYLFVGNGNRITIYDVATTTSGEPAIYVLGATTFTSNSVSQNLNRFRGAVVAIEYDSVRQYLFVSNANRVSIFDIATITTGESALFVLGTPGPVFSAGDLGVSSSTLYVNYGLTYASSTLYVSSDTYNRVSVFDMATISNGEGAVDLIGQYTSNDINNLVPSYNKSITNNGSIDEFGLNNPRDIVIDTARHRMFVTDSGNNRILVFNLNNDNTITDFRPDFVLGQPDFTSNSSSLAGLWQPAGLAYDDVGDRLFISDSVYGRVLVYDTSAIINGESPVHVLGQPDFSTSLGGAATQSGMRDTTSIAYSTTTGMLYVGQSTWRRITVYNIGDGITNGEPAVAVLGQADFTSSVYSVTGGASTTRNPLGLVIDNVNNRLFVSDSQFNRILVYDVSSITNGEDAIIVLGQPNFNSDLETTTQDGLSVPFEMAYDEKNNRLFVAELFNDRVVVYNTRTTINGEKAINVLGHINFTTQNSASISAPTTQSSTLRPVALEYDSDNELLYVVQRSDGSNRISIFNAGPDTTAPILTAATTSTSGTNIYITYNEPLDENSLPTTTDFIISVNGAASSPTAVSISGATIILTTSSTIYSTDTLTLTYTAGTYPVTDYSGNLAPNISASALTNLSTQTVSTSTPDPEPTPSRRRSGGGRVVRTPTTAESTPSTPQQQSNTSQTLPPSTTRPTVFTRNLTSGTTGEDVRTLQRFLNSQGYTVATQGNGSNGQETTYFGRATEAALKQFQLANNITPTGTMGPLTQARIAELTANAPATPVTPTQPTTPTAPQTTTPSQTTYTRDLFLGSRGSDVTSLQNFLIQQGYLESGFATGYFGQLTQSALIKFQQANNISPALGYFGPKTRGVVGR